MSNRRRKYQSRLLQHSMTAKHYRAAASSKLRAEMECWDTVPGHTRAKADSITTDTAVEAGCWCSGGITAVAPAIPPRSLPILPDGSLSVPFVKVPGSTHSTTVVAPDSNVQSGRCVPPNALSLKRKAVKQADSVPRAPFPPACGAV